jgi:SAM-dependent methyltransferase
MPYVSTCPVCEGSRLEPYARSAAAPERLHVEQAVCDGCGLLISQPQASQPEMDRYYRERYYRQNWPDGDAVVLENARTYERYELPLMKQLWSDWAPEGGATAVEIGCGYGAMLPLLQAEGFRVSGCDPSGDAVRFCRSRGLDVVEGGVPGAPLPGPFDVTIAQHVIEHVPDPRPFVAELVALTRPGGIVVIVTEDAWNAQYAWERGLARLRGRTPAFRSSFDHTFVFSAAHLERLLRAAGCDDVRTCTFSYVPQHESLHWRLYKGSFRTLDRVLGRGDFLMAAGRVGSDPRRNMQAQVRESSNR